LRGNDNVLRHASSLYPNIIFGVEAGKILMNRMHLRGKAGGIFHFVNRMEGDAEGEGLRFDTDKEIRLGIEKIRERLLELLAADIKTQDMGDNLSLIVTSTRNTIAWRNLSMLLGGKISYPFFSVPPVLFDPDAPYEVKSEFIRGFADVAGNVRLANRDQVGRHRVRLDVLNYATNWELPVQLCSLLQEHLGVPVSVITYGHPNLGREWREHQINIYCEDFTKVGFYFDFKQAALENLSKANYTRFPNHETKFCPGVGAEPRHISLIIL
jgi:hypothetical protein